MIASADIPELRLLALGAVVRIAMRVEWRLIVADEHQDACRVHETCTVRRALDAWAGLKADAQWTYTACRFVEARGMP